MGLVVLLSGLAESLGDNEKALGVSERRMVSFQKSVEAGTMVCTLVGAATILLGLAWGIRRCAQQVFQMGGIRIQRQQLVERCRRAYVRTEHFMDMSLAELRIEAKQRGLPFSHQSKEELAYNLTASEGFAVADLSTAKQRRYLECLAALRGTSLTDEERFVRASASARISQLKQELQGHT